MVLHGQRCQLAEQHVCPSYRFDRTSYGMYNVHDRRCLIRHTFAWVVSNYLQPLGRLVFISVFLAMKFFKKLETQETIYNTTTIYNLNTTGV